MGTPVIDRFREEHRYLSNFWPSPAAYDGHTYPTAEHAYQAAKTEDPDIREAIGQEPKPFAAKTHGSTLDLRQGWTEGLDVAAMSEVLASKFRLNPDLGRQLVATGSAILIEGNHWHDNNWGNCTCEAPECAGPGRNKLGHALMAVRAALAAEQKSLRPFAPYRIVRSADEMKGLASGSAVCAAWTPSEVFQRNSADDVWSVAGDNQEWSAQQVWGYFTEPFPGHEAG